MESDTLDAIDNFMNDASDQAAAWYSIIAAKPVTVPSAQIQAQQNLATAPITSGVVATPLGSFTVGGLNVGDNSTLFLLLGAAVVAYLLLK